MRAAVSRGLGDLSFEVRDVSLDDPQPHEVVVRVRASGLCASDAHVVKHDFGVPFPAVLGHEIAGVVLSVGSAVTRVAPGDHVIACLVRYCGRCEACLAEQAWMCGFPDEVDRTGPRSRLTEGGEAIQQFVNIGGFAEQVLTHENQLYVVPASMPSASAAIVGCAVITGAGAVWNAARVEHGETVAIVGCGGVGLQAIQAARLSGAKSIIAIDVDARKLDAARDLGATAAIQHIDDERTRRQIANGVDVALEFVGTPRSALTATRLTRRGGRAFLVGLHRPGVMVEIDLHREIFSERRTVGAVDMGGGDPRVDIPRILDLYARGEFHLDHLVGRRISLDEIGVGYEAVAAGGDGRVVVEIS